MKYTYFASDFHLGADGLHDSREREQRILRWLDHIAPQAEALYLLGDVFDYWFEYAEVIPKRFVRLLGKLGELRDAGVPIYFFTGNHDMWVFRYFEEELGIPTYRHPISRTIGGKRFLLGHGDGLGPGDYGYKFIKRVFANPVCQWLFARLHPNAGLRLMRFFSGSSRRANPAELEFLGPEREWLIQYCHRKLQTEHHDFFVFGHRHLPIDYLLDNGTSRYINTGDWLHHYSWAVFDGNDMEVRFWERQGGEVYGNTAPRLIG